MRGSLKVVASLTLLLVIPRCALALQFDRDPPVLAPLAEADHEMPTFQLSNARTGKSRDGKATMLMFDYRRTREGKYGAIEVVARIGNEPGGTKLFAGLNNNSESGTYRIRLGERIRDNIKKHGAEIFVIMEMLSSRRVGGGMQDIRYHFKLSNSTTLGKAKSQVTTRPPTADEKRRADVWRKPRKEIVAPPEYVLMSEADRTAEGMPVLYYSSEEWKPAEFVGSTDTNWKVLRLPGDKVQLSSTFDSFIAVRKVDVELLAADPAAYSPSVTLIPGTATLMPEGFVALPERLKLVPGTPVKVRYLRKTVDGFVLSARYSEVEVRYKWLAYHTGKFKRSYIMLTPQVIEWLEAEDAESRFARYIEEDNQVTPLEAAGIVKPESVVSVEPTVTADAGLSTPATDAPTVGQPTPADDSTVEAPSQPPPRKLKRYPIKVALPRGMRRISADTPLQPGIKVGCSWASRWYPVTVLALHDDGAVRIHWDDFGSAWDADLSREDLIIDERLSRTLGRKSRSPQASPRKWLDQSGKFEVLARFVKANGDKVHLRKTDGSEIVVPVSKLSDEDRQLVERLRAG